MRAHLARLRAVLACVSRQNVVIADGHSPDTVHTALLPGSQPRRLRGHPPLTFDLKERFMLVAAKSLVPRERWSIDVVEYAYSLYQRDDRLVATYHLHPSAPPVTWPHLHLGPAAGELSRTLASAHLPTGVVEPEDVLFLAIRELGVEPLSTHWEAILGPDRTAP